MKVPTKRGKPKLGGLSDPWLNTINEKMKCETCTTNIAQCPRHFEHLELVKPMFHIRFMILCSVFASIVRKSSQRRKITSLSKPKKIRNPKLWMPVRTKANVKVETKKW